MMRITKPVAATSKKTLQNGSRTNTITKPANKKSSPQADLTKENIAGSRQRKAQRQKAAANAPT